MEWAKTRSRARFNLAVSGLVSLPLADLPVKLSDLELSAPGSYGYEPLKRAIAAKYEVSPDCVVTTAGTSMGNHLAMAALLEPGDEVLMEAPAYEPMVTTARYLGARIVPFRRPVENGFRIDVREIERAATPNTRLIVLTNLHNPSSALTDDETLKRIGEIARVFVDEVYLDAASAKPAFHLGKQFISANSLTKIYGLSGLRCGWILAEPDLARRMWRLNDLFGVNAAHPAERLSCVAFENLDRIAARSRSLLTANGELLNRFLDSREDLEVERHRFGTVSFPRLRSGSVEALCRLLREKYETSVVPGSFFGMEQHFRIGISGETATLSAGLERLGMALDELPRSSPREA